MEDIHQKDTVEFFSGFMFSELKKCEVYTSDNIKLGKLQDAVFKPSSEGMDLTKFIVGGSFLEELQEDLGLKPDIDPVFTKDNIASVSPKHIRLNIPKEQVKSTYLDKDVISMDEIRLSKLSKLKILDSKSQVVGNIIDLKFYAQHFQFVIGDGLIREFFEDIGLRKDIDFLLSPRVISKFEGENILLSKAQEEMELMFKENITHEYKTQSQNIDIEKGRLSAVYPQQW